MHLANPLVRRVPGFDQAGVEVEVSCTACGAVGRHRVSTVTITTPIPQDAWDGFFTPTVLTCASCGAEDQYEVTGTCLAALALRVTATSQGMPGPVAFGLAVLWDGTITRRASQALRHLLANANATPDHGEGWRRLGNFCERAGRIEEALQHWTRAMTVDRAEFEAVYSLALACEVQAARSFAEEGLVRFSRIDGPSEAECAMAGELARLVCTWGAGRTMLASWDGGTVRGQHFVNMSSARLDSIAQPERIVDFLLEEEVLAIAFADRTVDEDEISRLEARLGAPHEGFTDARQPRLPPATRKVDKKKRKAQKKARKANRPRR